MPIVQAGHEFTAKDLKNQSGQMAVALRNILHQCSDFKLQLESWPDADLITLGLAQSEIDAIKGFFIGDLPNITDGFTNSTWVKKILGLGI